MSRVCIQEKGIRHASDVRVHWCISCSIPLNWNNNAVEDVRKNCLDCMLQVSANTPRRQASDAGLTPRSARASATEDSAGAIPATTPRSTCGSQSARGFGLSSSNSVTGFSLHGSRKPSLVSSVQYMPTFDSYAAGCTDGHIWFVNASRPSNRNCISNGKSWITDISCLGLQPLAVAAMNRTITFYDSTVRSTFV